MRRLALPFFLFPGLLPLALAGCSEGYSANTYAANAAQQEANVQRGVIIGVRPVLISANGAIGAATGAASGGVAGAQVSGGPIVTAMGTIGGALVGGIGGAAAEQAVADAKGWEYIVQETGEKLVSITQTSKIALPVGLHVLVIAGTQQARIVPDYTVPIAAASPTATAGGSAAAGMKPAATKTPQTAAASNGSTTAPIHASPLPPAAGAAGPAQAAPVTATSAPTVAAAAHPASTDPAATPQAPSSTSGAAAPLAAVSNKGPATGTPSAASTAMPVQLAPEASSAASPATPVQVAPGAASATPPVRSSSTATP